ncbi:MAG TPA: GNAT family N-acetyltransferase [Candidatus Binatia bacterium]|nr:GNAT family N-acetyltransferase [Candidatus Binatia bacterium]
MLTIRTHTDADRQAWDRFVLANDESHPAQLSGWLALTEETYGVPRRAWLAEEGGRVRGVLPLFEKRRFGRARALFSAPGGLLADDPDTARALIAVAEETRAREGIEYIELRDQRARWADLATNTEHCTHALALAGDAATQWRGFDAKLRNQIRKAQRAGFTVHWGAEHVRAFCRVMLESMRDLGTPMRAESWFRRALEVLGTSAALLVIARDGEPVGAMFLAVHRGCAMDLWASSPRRHFAHCPNQMLYWEAIQEAIRRGLHTFDFGRSQWDTGTFRFKAQWGASPVPLYYQYVLGASAQVPSFAAQRQRLGLAAELWKRLPLPLARILGDPIRRRFPELL